MVVVCQGGGKNVNPSPQKWLESLKERIMLCLSISISRLSRFSPKRQDLTLNLSVLLTKALYRGCELGLGPSVIQVGVTAKSYLTKRHSGWEQRKEMTLTSQEKYLEWNEVVGRINLFDFQASWLIFLFGEKLKRKKCTYFHLWISNLYEVALFTSAFFMQSILHEHSAWKRIIDLVTWLKEVSAYKLNWEQWEYRCLPNAEHQMGDILGYAYDIWN